VDAAARMILSPVTVVVVVRNLLAAGSSIARETSR
jgi:hypothetical protein